jgi:hypothetical protein
MKEMIVCVPERRTVLVSTELANHFNPTLDMVVETRDTFSRLAHHALEMTEGRSANDWDKLRNEAQSVLDVVAFHPQI